MPDDGIICLDNGMYKIWFARNSRTHIANTILLDTALAILGDAASAWESRGVPFRVFVSAPSPTDAG